jgi:hypothetical protein
VDKPVELIPLVCLRCSTPVPAETDEIAWVCAQCGQGLCLDEQQGLVPLEVNYAAGIPPNATGKPFWVAEGTVTLQRQSFGSSGKQAGEAQAFWSQPRCFFIPAFNSSLEDLLAQGTRLLLQPPDLQSGQAARFEPVTLHPLDVNAAAEFLVMAIEAGRPDKLKEIDFNLQLSPPVLWILP